jgi:hypothetical protein
LIDTIDMNGHFHAGGARCVETASYGAAHGDIACQGPFG